MGSSESVPEKTSSFTTVQYIQDLDSTTGTAEDTRVQSSFTCVVVGEIGTTTLINETKDSLKTILKTALIVNGHVAAIAALTGVEWLAAMAKELRKVKNDSKTEMQKFANELVEQDKQLMEGRILGALDKMMITLPSCKKKTDRKSMIIDVCNTFTEVLPTLFGRLNEVVENSEEPYNKIDVYMKCYCDAASYHLMAENIKVKMFPEDFDTTALKAFAQKYAENVERWMPKYLTFRMSQVTILDTSPEEPSGPGFEYAPDWVPPEMPKRFDMTDNYTNRAFVCHDSDDWGGARGEYEYYLRKNIWLLAFNRM